jgi:SAM-dependent methyltransferase
MHNLESHLQSLAFTLLKVEDHRCRIDWLLELGEGFTSILNLGCLAGYETIALLWFLNGDQAIGIDIDADAIRSSRSMVKTFIDDLKQLRLAPEPSIRSSKEFHRSIVSILETYGPLPMPSFKEVDITREIALPRSSYDLAYCHKVLYNLKGHLHEYSWQEVIFHAIGNVSTLLATGGLFIAIEPLTRSSEDTSPVDLDNLFIRANLEQVQVGDFAPHLEGMRVYCYRKS